MFLLGGDQLSLEPAKTPTLSIFQEKAVDRLEEVIPVLED